MDQLCLNIPVLVEAELYLLSEVLLILRLGGFELVSLGEPPALFAAEGAAPVSARMCSWG